MAPAHMAQGSLVTYMTQPVSRSFADRGAGLLDGIYLRVPHRVVRFAVVVAGGGDDGPFLHDDRAHRDLPALRGLARVVQGYLHEISVEHHGLSPPSSSLLSIAATLRTSFS